MIALALPVQFSASMTGFRVLARAPALYAYTSLTCRTQALGEAVETAIGRVEAAFAAARVAPGAIVVRYASHGRGFFVRVGCEVSNAEAHRLDGLTIGETPAGDVLAGEAGALGVLETQALMLVALAESGLTAGEHVWERRPRDREGIVEIFWPLKDAIDL